MLSTPLRSFTDKTLTSPEEIYRQLEDIRQQGYALDFEEFEVGVCAIAAPIFNRHGDVIAAIGGPSPVSRMTPERIKAMAAAFQQAAEEISLRMGWQL